MKLSIIIISSLCFLSFVSCAQLQPVPSGVYHWDNHPVKTGKDRESRKILEGTSPHFEYLKIHATTQFPGAKPGQAHANEDMEECIIVKEGTMKITLMINGETEMNIAGKKYQGKAGDFYLMNSELFHGVSNASDKPCSYFAFKWN